MRRHFFIFLTAAVLVCSAAAAKDSYNATSKKGGRVFSLFNVIQFDNEGCRADSTVNGNSRNGTCYTSEECTSKGGVKSGNCAAGFGVCCLFATDECGATANQNCTYLRNPEFPSALPTDESSCSYTIEKCAEDVCQFRLDFESFTLLGQALTDETEAVCPNDKLVASVDSKNAVPTICGSNQGQHIYLDVGNKANDGATLTFTIDNAMTATRNWEVKVTQIKCDSELRAPDGCLQYFVGLVGRITSFDFGQNSRHLNDQRYSSCIRQEQGFCCTEYSVCEDANSFMLDADTATALVDTSCTLDFVIIDGARADCSNSGNLFNRFCGQFLSAFGTSDLGHHSVCDCSAPFFVGINTNVDPAAVATASNGGLCLNYRQVACSSRR